MYLVIYNCTNALKKDANFSFVYFVVEKHLIFVFSSHYISNLVSHRCWI